jgi:hypothetical protein
LTIALAALLLAGRTALDPTFSPPIFSRSNISGSVSEPRAGRELVPAARVPRLAGISSSSNHVRLGYVAAAKVRFVDLAGTTLRPYWVLRRAGSKDRRVPVSGTFGEPIIPAASSETRNLRGWIPLPPLSGRYFIELRLVEDIGEVPGHLRSRPFVALGRRCCHRYKAPSYVAALPLGWHLRSPYFLASPHRYVTRFTGPAGMELVIDTTLNVNGDPLDSQQELESILSQGSERYKRLSVRTFEVQHEPVVEWSYRSGQDFYANELFFRGQDGYAILGSSSLAHFREVRDLCRRLARLLRNRSG